MSAFCLSTMATLILASNSVDIRTAPDCPSAEQVGSKLRPLLASARTPGSAVDVALVDVVESRPDGALALRLRLLRPDGTAVGDRRLLLQASCEEMADAVASVIAAWETDLDQVTDAVSSSAGSTNVNVGAASVPAPAKLLLELGVSAGAAFIGGTAAAASIEAAAGRSTSRWRLRVAAASETDRTVKLDVGEVHWKHTTANAGLMLGSLGNRWRFFADLGAIVGWATLGGRGYPSSNEQRSSFEYGAAAGFRLQRSLGRFAVWAEGRTNLWFQNQRAILTGSASRAELQNVDVMASLGGSVTLLP